MTTNRIEIPALFKTRQIERNKRSIIDQMRSLVSPIDLSRANNRLLDDLFSFSPGDSLQRVIAGRIINFEAQIVSLALNYGSREHRELMGEAREEKERYARVEQVYTGNEYRHLLSQRLKRNGVLSNAVNLVLTSTQNIKVNLRNQKENESSIKNQFSILFPFTYRLFNSERDRGERSKEEKSLFKIFDLFFNPVEYLNFEENSRRLLRNAIVTEIVEDILPNAFQSPKDTFVKIVLFKPEQSEIDVEFKNMSEIRGKRNVKRGLLFNGPNFLGYLEVSTPLDIPILNEEIDVLNSIAKRLSTYIINDRKEEIRIETFEHTKDSLAVFNPATGQIMEINATGALMLKKTPDECVGKTLEELVPPDIKEIARRIQKTITRVGSGREHNRVRNVLMGEHWYRSETIRLESGFVLNILTNIDNAILDSLTEFKNRRYWDETIESELERSKRYNDNLSLLFLDLDHFKEVNDSYGHPFGDMVLKTFAKIIELESRGSDIPIRWGGDEFSLLLPNTDYLGAHIIAERIRLLTNSIWIGKDQKIYFDEKNYDLFKKEADYLIENKFCEKSPRVEDNVLVTLSASIGIAEFNKRENSKDFLERADLAEKRAKDNGKNCIVIAN